MITGKWIGRTHGRLTVWLEIEKYTLIVDCTCGKRKTISKSAFYVARSCGCFQKEQSAENMRKIQTLSPANKKRKDTCNAQRS